ncbi:MAG: helix-turn-helix domain-containing protein [Rikenellaceae bacterium]|nr:helix-turn-helix domain-containing protein [Rikenellaceae bacterium]
MTRIIVIAEDELRSLLRGVIREFVTELKSEKKPEPDTMNFDSLLSFLSEQGYDISKSKFYKLSSKNEIPHRKLGRKLIFSRKEIMNWMELNLDDPTDRRSEQARILAESARRKMRYRK